MFDTDDTDSGNDQDSNGDDTYPTPRSIQSATPQSTKYDNPERDVPEITTKTEKYLDEGAEVQAQFDAEEGIGASFVVYNYESSNFTGEWYTDEMKIEGGKRSKNGSWQTSVEVLENLSDLGYEIAELILNWRHFSKLKSTYTDALVEQINAKTIEFILTIQWLAQVLGDCPLQTLIYRIYPLEQKKEN